MDRDARRAHVRRALLAVVLLILLGLAWTGLSGGFQQISQSRTAGQKAQTASQLAYGLLSLLSIVTTFLGRLWSRAVLACWVIAVTLAGGLAPVVWGGSGVGVGLLSAGASFLIILAIVGLLRVGARGLTSE